MRVGTNPVKNTSESIGAYFHQVVIPVYIPDSEGYFKNSFAIFQKCLTSLITTCHGKTFITVVSNGSTSIVEEYLNSLYKNGSIHEVIYTQNIGKINAFYKGFTGHNFPLITITDADVLFLNGWQEATYSVFNEFPRTGFVSTTPIPKLLKYNTEGTFGAFLFSKKLRFQPVLDKDALLHFDKSLGEQPFYNPVHLEKILTLQGKKSNAVLGSGHFIATYRAEVFDSLKQRYSSLKLGGESVRNFLDKPVIDSDYWRLSTERNYTYHMGNVLEPWMDEVLLTLKKEKYSSKDPHLPNLKRASLSEKLWSFVCKYVFFRKPLWKMFLKLKGLNFQEAKSY